MYLRGILEPSLDNIDLVLGRRDAAGRLLFEYVQDVDNAGKRRGVDDAVGISPLRIGDLEHTRATEPFERLCVRVLLPFLGQPQRVPNNVFDVLWKVPQVIDARAHEHELPLRQACLLMPILAYSSRWLGYSQASGRFGERYLSADERAKERTKSQMQAALSQEAFGVLSAANDKQLPVLHYAPYLHAGKR
jgi:hypothetical protein